MNDQQPEAGNPYEGYLPVLRTTLRQLFTPGKPLLMPCSFRYSVQDPFAVGIDLRLTSGVSVTWMVARDLLQEGMHRSAGEGDFRVWPSSPHLAPGPRLYFSLIRPSGHVTFEADHSEVERWLDATYELVPAGCESELFDWETLEANLRGTS